MRNEIVRTLCSNVNALVNRNRQKDDVMMMKIRWKDALIVYNIVYTFFLLLKCIYIIQQLYSR